MEFDKTRIYTAVNADELKAGDLVIAALTLDELEHKVKSGMDIQTLDNIADSSHLNRFGLNLYNDVDNLRYYPLAYLVKPPKEPKYKPFSSIEKVMNAIVKHGGWVSNKINGDLKLIVSISGSDSLHLIGTGGAYFTPQELLECFVFLDDSTPCGDL